MLTIWMLALMTLSVSYFSLWMDELITSNKASGDDLRAERDLVSTQSLVYYVLATVQADYKGYQLPDQNVRDAEEAVYLRIDGRPYLGVGETCFSIQDESGLIRQSQLLTQYNRVLSMHGVPQGKVAPLVAQLFDFVDTDAERRVNGAEAPEYREVDKPDPPNRPLLTSWELRDVLDWDKYLGLWSEIPIARLVSVQQIGGLLNFNFAPRELLLVVDGVGGEEADGIIAAREEEPFKNVSQVFAAAGKNLDLQEMEMTFSPSRYERVTLWSRKGYQAREIVYQVKASGAAFTTPIDTDYVVYPPKSYLGKELLRKGDALSESVF